MRILCFHTQNHQQHHSHEEISNNHLHSESSTSSSSSSSSLSSQPSLPSVPSLTPSNNHSLQSHLITTLTSSSPIFSLILHGKSLFTASFNSQIRSFTRNPNFTFTPQNDAVSPKNGAVKSLVISRDFLFSAHQDHKIRVWKIRPEYPDPESKPGLNHVATLPTVADRFCRFFYSRNYVHVRRHIKRTWVHHVDAVSSLAVSRDGSTLYSASWDRSFKVWRVSDFKCVESVRAHDDAINALVLSFCEDGVVYVFTGSADKKIKIWRTKNGEKKHCLVGSLEKHKSAVNALALSGDGCVLYSGACDRSILVWEKEGNSGENNGMKMVLVGALRGHTKAILSLVAMEDLVCSGSADNSVRVWRRGVDKRYACVAVLEGHTKPVKCLAMVVDSSKFSNSNSNNGGSGSGTSCSYVVYSGSLDCSVKVWEVQVPLF